MVTSKHCDRIILVFCIAICLLALIIGYFREVGAFGVESDFYEVYAVQAENILAGRSYTYQYKTIRNYAPFYILATWAF